MPQHNTPTHAAGKPARARVAYFTMEIGLRDELPTYSGGLGVLAGDTVRSAADLRVPMVAVTLLHRGGYFRQSLDAGGTQRDERVRWEPADQLTELEPTVTIKLEGKDVAIGAWMTTVRGSDGFEAPVLYLDTDRPENAKDDRAITDRLYGGGDELRLRQEAVLGVGGVRMLEALGYTNLARYHMNEGHAALLVPELRLRLAKRLGAPPSDDSVERAVAELCVFTTHTPVPAGHDRFPMDLARRLLEPELADLLEPEPAGRAISAPVADGPSRPARSAVADKPRATPNAVLNMTLTGFAHSGRINAVARRHGEVSRRMFGRADITAITNGVHAATWVCPPMADLFDRYTPGWREDNTLLRGAVGIEPAELLDAHGQAKADLVERVNRDGPGGFAPERFTIGFGRRATAYKRLTLLLSDPRRLTALADDHGPIQVVLAGKAHPKDEPGQQMIADALRLASDLGPSVAVAYLPNYDMELCGLMVAGSDVWLNTPRPPLEASGTSGMKAAMNGVPSLSTLDGWWLEGCVEGVTGWAIGADDFASERPDAPAPDTERQDADHADDLYEALDLAVLPLFHGREAADAPGAPGTWAGVMAHAIALNGSTFTTQRMVADYAARLYVV